MQRIVGLGTALVTALGLAACSGDGGSPVSPSMLPDGGATTIAGTARSAGQTNGLSVGALSHNGDELEVCVVGTNVCAMADGNGRFELVGDFAGDVTLRFRGSGHNARVTVHDVEPGQTITVMVTLNGNDSSVDIESRHGGDDKVALCHREGNGNFHRIEVAPDAVAAHEAHGDGRPGGVVPNTDPSLMFDDDCNVLGQEEPEEPEEEEEEDEEEEDDGDEQPRAKVQLCHRSGNDRSGVRYHLIEVSEDAVPAHLGHGDHRPGDGPVDENCDVRPSS